MLYVLLIYEAEDVSAGYTAADTEAALAGHRELQQRSKRDGAFVEANQLMRPETALSLRMRGGAPVVTDGPFTETKELLIGYYVLECASLDQAIEYAQQIPHASTGGIEIRPITYFERSQARAVVWTSSD
jgi:hypothetical protein